MKILHTADWHLGKKLERFSRIEEQREVMDEICQIANKEQVDLVLVAGDVFDQFNPTNEAIELLYKTLYKLTANGSRPVVVIAGNHDSPDKIEVPDVLAKECGIIFAGYPDTNIGLLEVEDNFIITQSAPGFIELKLKNIHHPIRLLFTPYANEIRLRKELVGEKEDDLRNMLARSWEQTVGAYCDSNGINLLMCHLLFVKGADEKPEETEGEKSILTIGGASTMYSNNIPKSIDYTALGHLHRCHEVSGTRGRVFYSGSPLAYSFGESDQDKFVLIVDIEVGKVKAVTSVKLESGKRLFKKRFESVDAAVEWLISNPDCLVELAILCDSYMTGEERKKLYEVHDGIVTVIPEVRSEEHSSKQLDQLDLSQSTEELFVEYFQSKIGILPNEEILQLFNEIRSIDCD